MGVDDIMNSWPKCAAIPTVCDEDESVKGTIGSVISQTVSPAEWMNRDNGSSDGTPDIIGKNAKKYRNFMSGVQPKFTALTRFFRSEEVKRLAGRRTIRK
jgi:glycosyltransferase involved in cell wall biosynthesis